METLIISNTNDVGQAAELLKAGGLVASPTETVYGLCANALNEEAVKKIYAAKGRPSDNPLIVHIADLSMLQPLVKEISPIAQTLMRAFWPGPMTLIFKASPLVPKVVTGGLDTVAVRFPSDPTIAKLIKTSGLPLAAPSANTSGKPSPTNFARVYEDLNGKIATILRPGGITFEMLEEVLGKVMMDPALGHKLKEGEVPRAPGMKYTHYSPNAEVIIVRGTQDKVVEKINALVKEASDKGKKVGVMATDETLPFFKAETIISVGTEKDPSTIAANLFEVLREYDDAKVDLVYTLAFSTEGIGQAIMNRLEKSAGYHFIEA